MFENTINVGVIVVLSIIGICYGQSSYLSNSRFNNGQGTVPNSNGFNQPAVPANIPNNIDQQQQQFPQQQNPQQQFPQQQNPQQQFPQQQNPQQQFPGNQPQGSQQPIHNNQQPNSNFQPGNFPDQSLDNRYSNQGFVFPPYRGFGGGYPNYGFGFQHQPFGGGFHQNGFNPYNG